MFLGVLDSYYLPRGRFGVVVSISLKAKRLILHFLSAGIISSNLLPCSDTGKCALTDHGDKRRLSESQQIHTLNMSFPSPKLEFRINTAEIIPRFGC
jgi:hypothetical protein